MANPEHIEWLLKGVEAWNHYRDEKRRSGDILFTPQLENENLGSKFQETGRYNDFGLIPLGGIDLSGAYLVNSTLNLADLSNADFSGADLRRAKLIDSNLSNANFFNANLHDTDMSGSNLAGAIFARSQRDEQATKPWEARLYPCQDDQEPHTVEHDSIENVEGFLREIKSLVGHQAEQFSNDKEKPVLYFRGEPKCGWDLVPSVMRDEELKKSEGEMLRELTARRPDEFSRLNYTLAEWVLAQHHLLPTRFIDITRNPLVALFFACEEEDKYKDKDARLHIFSVPRALIKPFNSDAISVITNLAKLSQNEKNLLLCREGGEYNNFLLAKLRLYQGIRQEKPYFDERIDIRDLYRVFVVEPQQTPERIRAQSGALLASAFHERLEPGEIRRWNGHIPVYTHYRLTIPSGCKEQIRNELRLLNITKETLFPGLDESSKAVKEMYSGGSSPTST